MESIEHSVLSTSDRINHLNAEISRLWERKSTMNKIVFNNRANRLYAEVVTEEAKLDALKSYARQLKVERLEDASRPIGNLLHIDDEQAPVIKFKTRTRKTGPDRLTIKREVHNYPQFVLPLDNVKQSKPNRRSRSTARRKPLPRSPIRTRSRTPRR